MYNFEIKFEEFFANLESHKESMLCWICFDFVENPLQNYGFIFYIKWQCQKNVDSFFMFTHLLIYLFLTPSDIKNKLEKK